jgi:hypothetical protein
MPVITYTAVNRGRLASGHSASTQYQIECELESFPEVQISKGIRDETLDGTPEMWLDALLYEYQVRSDLVLNADKEDWQEFFSSVAAGEPFQIDFTGTIASPGTDIDLVMSTPRIQEQQIGGIGSKYTFTCRTYG